MNRWLELSGCHPVVEVVVLVEGGRRRRGLDATVGHDEESATESIQFVGLRLIQHGVQGFTASSSGSRPSPVHHDPALQSSELAVIDRQTTAAHRTARSVPPTHT